MPSSLKGYDPHVLPLPALLNNLTELAQWRQSVTGPVALVPTMGALHAGHQQLMAHALTLAPTVVVSVFVNPTQFGPTEDFTRYPRTWQADVAMCQQMGVAAVFTPTPQDMFPHGLQTAVLPPEALTAHFCGASRPGHFTGVATVVCKLFGAVQPTVAVFGQKDAQQLAVIRHMVADLNLPVRIEATPTQRDADGLALSSRNQYLTTPASRQAALVLPLTLQAVQAQLTAQQGVDAVAVLAQCQAQVMALQPPPLAHMITWEYLAAVNDETFAPVTTLTPNVRILGALRIADPTHGIAVRLIDNM
jgi:pantoate--beta-alanine ligase